MVSDIFGCCAFQAKGELEKVKEATVAAKQERAVAQQETAAAVKKMVVVKEELQQLLAERQEAEVSRG